MADDPVHGSRGALVGSAAIAIQALHTHCVGLKVLTGDNGLIRRNACREVGLVPDPTLAAELLILRE